MVQLVVLSPLARRSVLVAHVACAVGWLGAAAAFLSLSIAGLRTHDEQTVQAAYMAMDVIIRFVLVPAALSGLVAGLVLATGTPWGLFRHWWVLLKFLVTVPAAVILIGTLGTVSDLAHAHAAHTAGPVPAALHDEGMHLLTHAAGGLLVLLVPVALSVFKPFGRTPLAKHSRQREPSSAM